MNLRTQHLARLFPVTVLACLLLTNWCRAQGAREGFGNPAGGLDPLIQKIVSEISEERIAAILKRLEAFETRNTLSDPAQATRGIGAARQWIFDELKSYSPRLEVSFDTQQAPRGGRLWKDVELRNVVAVLPGKMDQSRSRWILVGGHYDSLNLRVPEEARGDPAKTAEIIAPGVNDDGSGVACAMECARVLSRYEFDATLVFVAFVAEEQGLIGARGLATRLKEKGQEVQALLNVDTVGNDTAGNGMSDSRRILVFSEDPSDSPSRQLARYIKRIGERYVSGMSVDMIFRHDRFGRGGDHTAFNELGFPGVRFTTPMENYSQQHTPDDTFANIAMPYTTRVICVNAAVMANMALAPRSPVTTSQMSMQEPRAQQGVQAAASPQRLRAGITRGAGYDAVLRWDHPNPEPDLAGYIVVVRSTTAPDWEREIWVGNVREFTMKDTPIDQWVFGVKAVDRDGHESPVSAYWTQPRRVQ